MEKIKKEVSFKDAMIPIVGLLLVLVYGLLIQPLVLKQEAVPLEIIFVFASILSVINLARLGIDWPTIEKSVINKLTQGLPAFFILFAIGILIGSWIISGTVPMLIYYGIKIINIKYIYAIAFILPCIFSTLTGTSWGSAGTIGVVLIGIGSVIDANLPLLAGAIVGGSYFGDKISPLSDTTNMAAIASGVPLYEHIRSMMNTTIPAAVLATIVYFGLGFVYAPQDGMVDMSSVNATLKSLDAIFDWNILLVIPIIIVLYGSITKKATTPTLLASSVSAVILALMFQQFSIGHLIKSLNTGFDVSMVTWTTDITPDVQKLLTRGGLYNLITAITSAFVIFFFIGTLDSINAMKLVVDRALSFAKTRKVIVLISQLSTAFTNALTSNQHATSFIIGSAFAIKYDEKDIPRNILSRTIEDFGTMLESMLPWTTTGLYMSATLGVATIEYAPYQLLSLFNFAIAFFLVSIGFGLTKKIVKSVA